jgi:hypothetical protein
VKRNRSWISLIGYCGLMVFGAAFAFAVIVAGGSVALASHQNSEDAQNTSPMPAPRTGTAFSGMITDSRCGARHIRNSRLSSAECTRDCVRKGARYTLVDGDHRYILTGNDETLGRLAGTRANVTGSRQGDIIAVSAAAPLL